MNAAGDGLWIAAAASLVAAVALTLIGGRHAPTRGWRLWQFGAWACTGGVTLLAGAAPQHWAITPAMLLLLLWPMLALIGMRRFHARIEWPGGEPIDCWVFLGCAMLLAATGLLPRDSAMAAVVPPVGILASWLYAAVVLVCAGSSRSDARPLLLLAAVLAGGAFVPTLVAVGGADQRALADTAAASTAMGSLAMSFIVTRLAFDRSERHLQASRRRLRALASIDPLTQVPNRRHFEELATQALAHDPPASAVLLMFDIDHFKRVNDQYGHAGGDRALRLVSRCVREVLRVQDIPCRHGGDEFALLLRHASVTEAMRVASRLVDRVQSLSAATDLPTLSLSFGVVQVRPTELLGQALQRADLALYEAKRQGRSRAVASGGTDSHERFTESRPLGLSSA